MSSRRSGAAVFVEWLRQAQRDLDELATYIAQDDPTAARLVVDRVIDAVAKLTTSPGTGKLGRVPGTRELAVPKTSYIVPYRVHGEAVQILRVFHTSRKPPTRW